MAGASNGLPVQARSSIIPEARCQFKKAARALLQTAVVNFQEVAAAVFFFKLKFELQG
jgi:hypothetical protein